MCSATDDFDLLAHELAVLMRHYARVQADCAALAAAQRLAIDALEAELLRARAAAVIHLTARAFAREDRAALEAAAPGLRRRAVLQRDLVSAQERVQDLIRERQYWQRRAHAAEARIGEPQPGSSVLCLAPDEAGTLHAQDLRPDGSGQLTAIAGVRVSSEAELEASLLAADLVICQTGCISHDAYWRVQDHCKRTGKPCMLVEHPQAIRLVRRGGRLTAVDGNGPLATAT
ncbi:DUF2325 domain-containing protein [Uliginosibacterium sp. H1]|uniref:DUF2325 domain-containing protein n=1 Tax=Uliginosibacterium sp. H1 TaxID=3114757 RepID=UPI002E1901EE|nr:DUF2325 domain-containing protein [Uliginosibacterium sp. H1]